MSFTYDHAHVVAVQQLWYGHDNKLNLSDFEYAWKAIKTIAGSDGSISSREGGDLFERMSAMMTPPDVITTVLEWDEDEADPVALINEIDFAEDERARVGAWIIYEALTVAMSDEELAAGEIGRVRQIATEVGLSSEFVDDVAILCKDEADLRRRRAELLAVE